MTFTWLIKNRPCHDVGCYSPAPNLGSPDSGPRPFLQLLRLFPVSTIPPATLWTASLNNTWKKQETVNRNQLCACKTDDCRVKKQVKLVNGTTDVKPTQDLFSCFRRTVTEIQRTLKFLRLNNFVTHTSDVLNCYWVRNVRHHCTVKILDSRAQIKNPNSKLRCGLSRFLF